MSSSSKKSLKREIDEVLSSQDSPSSPRQSKRKKESVSISDGNISNYAISVIIKNMFLQNIETDTLQRYTDLKRINKHWKEAILSLERGASTNRLWEEISKTWFPRVQNVPSDLFLAMQKNYMEALVLIEADEKSGKAPVHVNTKDGLWFLHFRRTCEWITGIRVKIGEEEKKTRMQGQRGLNSLKADRHTFQSSGWTPSIESIIYRYVKINDIEPEEREIVKRLIYKHFLKTPDKIPVSITVVDKRGRLADEEMYDINTSKWEFYPSDRDAGVIPGLFVNLVHITGQNSYMASAAEDFEGWESRAILIKNAIDSISTDDELNRELALLSRTAPKSFVNMYIVFYIKWTSMNDEMAASFQSHLNPYKSAKFAKSLLGETEGNEVRMNSIYEYLYAKLFKVYTTTLEEKLREIRNRTFEKDGKDDDLNVHESEEAIMKTQFEVKKKSMIAEVNIKISFYRTVASHMRHFFNRLEDGYGEGFWKKFVTKCFPLITQLPERMIRYGMTEREENQKWCNLAKMIWFWSVYSGVNFSTSSVDANFATKRRGGPLTCTNTSLEYYYDTIYDRTVNTRMEQILDLESAGIYNLVNWKGAEVSYFMAIPKLYGAVAQRNGLEQEEEEAQFTLYSRKLKPIIGQAYYTYDFLVENKNKQKWVDAVEKNTAIKFNSDNVPSSFLKSRRFSARIEWGNINSEICDIILKAQENLEYADYMYLYNANARDLAKVIKIRYIDEYMF